MNKWSPLQKIAFRFFFVFLSLQVLTENFLVFLFGIGDLTIWDIGAKIFTPPCLWLNDHIFHYKYIPQLWSSFSGALHTIRDIVYLLIAAIACIVWSILDRKRENYNRLFYWFSLFVIPVISGVVFGYGISKLIPVQMHYPNFTDAQKHVGDLTPFELIWLALGYGQPYQIFTGLFEVVGAVLILFKRTRVVGLIVIACVMLNVVMIDYAYVVGNVMITAFYILLISMFLMAPYAVELVRFFLRHENASLNRVVYAPRKNIAIKIFWVLFIGITFTLTTRDSYRIYVRREKKRASEQKDKAILRDSMTLFKTQRVVIIFDDYSDQE